MKYKTTGSRVRAGYYAVYAADEGALRDLDCKPVAYTSGVYGWNYDVFEFGGGRIAVCSGYRSVPGKPLPDAARRVLANLRRFVKWCNDLDKLEAYRENAKRRFNLALVASCGGF